MGRIHYSLIAHEVGVKTRDKSGQIDFVLHQIVHLSSCIAKENG
jgi:hypothetical protein